MNKKRSDLQVKRRLSPQDAKEFLDRARNFASAYNLEEDFSRKLALRREMVHEIPEPNVTDDSIDDNSATFEEYCDKASELQLMRESSEDSLRKAERPNKQKMAMHVIYAYLDTYCSF